MSYESTQEILYKLIAENGIGEVVSVLCHIALERSSASCSMGETEKYVYYNMLFNRLKEFKGD